MDSDVTDQSQRMDFYDAACSFVEAGRSAQAPESMLRMIEMRMESSFNAFLFCAPEALPDAKYTAKERMWSIVLTEVDSSKLSAPYPSWVHAMGQVYQTYIWR